jgi:PAS domain S-box-containing protein
MSNLSIDEAGVHQAIVPESQSTAFADGGEGKRERLKEMLRHVPVAIGLLHGPEHRWVYVNDRYVKVTGRSSAEEFVGKTIRESLPELEGQPFFNLLDRVYETGEPCEGQEIKAQLLRAGELQDAYFDFVYQPICNGAGETDGILVHAIEVTDRVLARKAIDESHERLVAAHMASQQLAEIVLSSEDAIVSKDLQGIVTSWNPGAEKMFGYTAEEMIGTSITRILPPEMVDDEERILATIARGERIQHFETVRMTKDGERIDVSLTISPVRDESGRIVGASKIARDITQRKRSERALRTTERLASVGRLAATIAHEINNPLEAVTNLVYLAKANTEDPVVRPYLDQAEEELSRVSLLTRQTLGFYRETKGTRALTLGSVITPLVFALQPRARTKAVGIWTNLRQDPEIQAVPGEIRQLIANLIGNSIDAAAGGSSIQVRVSEVSFVRGERKAGVRLTISDQGEGIPLSARARIFEPFFTTKKEAGTGLGLWVCQNIVEKHGGSIRYRTSTGPGQSGTVFCVFLPCEAAASLDEADGQQLSQARGAA